VNRRVVYDDFFHVRREFYRCEGRSVAKLSGWIVVSKVCYLVHQGM
jgi:hypothetical protein